VDIASFNRDWLKAWSDKDVDALVTKYYAQDVVYKDGQTTAGLQGSEALRGYLSGLFAAMPPTHYDPDQVWALEGGAGYCGRWIATMDLPDGNKRRFRGFDLCILSGGKIVLNEVYTHDLAS
jgi:ketosteroid isomerase-like protein